MDRYQAYYFHQAQGGSNGGPVYIGVQSGYGLGNILSAGFRLFSPMFKRVNKAFEQQTHSFAVSHW